MGRTLDRVVSPVPIATVLALQTDLAWSASPTCTPDPGIGTRREESQTDTGRWGQIRLDNVQDGYRIFSPTLLLYLLRADCNHPVGLFPMDGVARPEDEPGDCRAGPVYGWRQIRRSPGAKKREKTLQMHRALWGTNEVVVVDSVLSMPGLPGLLIPRSMEHVQVPVFTKTGKVLVCAQWFKK